MRDIHPSSSSTHLSKLRFAIDVITGSQMVSISQSCRERNDRPPAGKAVTLDATRLRSHIVSKPYKFSMTPYRPSLLRQVLGLYRWYGVSFRATAKVTPNNSHIPQRHVGRSGWMRGTQGAVTVNAASPFIPASVRQLIKFQSSSNTHSPV